MHFWSELTDSRRYVRDLGLLRLYVAVLSTLKGFGDQLWVEVVPNLDSMNDQVLAYQAQAKKLPKASPNSNSLLCSGRTKGIS